jgi:hypothetical protein
MTGDHLVLVVDPGQARESCRPTKTTGCVGLASQLWQSWTTIRSAVISSATIAAHGENAVLQSSAGCGTLGAQVGSRVWFADLRRQWPKQGLSPENGVLCWKILLRASAT